MEFAQNVLQLILIVLQMTLVIVPTQILFGRVQLTNALQLNHVQIQRTTQEITFVQIVLKIVKNASQVFMTLQECAKLVRLADM